jgi:hypothetical protein
MKSSIPETRKEFSVRDVHSGTVEIINMLRIAK